MNLEEIKKNGPFAIGGENVDYAQYFDGTSYLNMISLKQVVVGNVTFEAGCRNPGQRQALARCRQGQCLPASGHRSRRDRYEYGMV